MFHKITLTLLIAAVSVLGAACEPDSSDNAGLANPASVYCEEQGYELEIVTDEDGNQSGICIFPDGSSCDEWAFFRGECGPQE